MFLRLHAIEAEIRLFRKKRRTERHIKVYIPKMDNYYF